MTPLIPQDDHLEDFTCRQVTLGGVTKTVYVTGTRPRVVAMAKIPGISPYVARFVHWVYDAGLTVYTPSLLGCDSVVSEVDADAEVFRHACMSAEFRVFAANQSSLVMQQLRCLAWLTHVECSGPGVGAIGMYFIGNSALTMILEPAMLVPVLCQPPLLLDVPDGIEVMPEDVTTVRQRLEQKDPTVLIYRFEDDRFCRTKCFTACVYALDNRPVSRVLLDSTAYLNPPSFSTRHVPCLHNVVMAHLIDVTGESTLIVRDETLASSQQRLG